MQGKLDDEVEDWDSDLDGKVASWQINSEVSDLDGKVGDRDDELCGDVENWDSELDSEVYNSERVGRPGKAATERWETGEWLGFQERRGDVGIWTRCNLGMGDNIRRVSVRMFECVVCLCVQES